MSTYKTCKLDPKRAMDGSDFCNVHQGHDPEFVTPRPVGYSGVMEAMKTPSQWEAEEGTYVVNRSVYPLGEAVPISKEEFFKIIRPLTRALMLDKAPETISKSQAIEQIETQIEEWKEAGMSTIDYDAGLIRGLELALQTIQDL